VFIWKVPGVTPAGAACGRPVDYTCVYPTICSLTGMPLPAHLDGKDISSLLKDPQAKWDHPAITTHGRQNHTVRTEGWRYIRYASGDEELYDEAADPLEYTNLAQKPEHAARKAELAKLLPATDAENLPNSRGGGEGEGEGGKKKGSGKKKAKAGATN
jgi:arylsulfatase A-like enzyme